MKKVRELKKWIELYNEVNAAAEELQLAYEYVKEEIITEDEVDAAYAKALELVGLGFHADAYVFALCGIP